MLTPLIPGEPSFVECLEKTTPRYTFTVLDDTGAALPAATLSTLTLTLYAILSNGTKSYIRGSANAGQNVLNANNVTVSAGGVGVWSAQVADTTRAEDLDVCVHIALWEWTWPTSRAGKHELRIAVKKLAVTH